MSQIKVKKLLSLLLSINTLNTLCAPAGLFHLEQEKEVCVIFFFHFVLVDMLSFLLFMPVLLLMPLLTPETSVPLFTVPGVQ